MRLFHFSDDPDIVIFEPRPVSVPAQRRAGSEWLNGPLVWAIDGWHQPMYLFPRECPRILLWPTPRTADEDRKRWMGDTQARMVACIEQSWLDRLGVCVIFRYEFDAATFESLDDAGMWVSRKSAAPIDVKKIDNFESELCAQGVEQRILDSLLPLCGVWSSSLHASGIRLRNAAGWARY
jgi:hypothetical protein